MTKCCGRDEKNKRKLITAKNLQHGHQIVLAIESPICTIRRISHETSHTINQHARHRVASKAHDQSGRRCAGLLWSDRTQSGRPHSGTRVHVAHRVKPQSHMNPGTKNPGVLLFPIFDKSISWKPTRGKPLVSRTNRPVPLGSEVFDLSCMGATLRPRLFGSRYRRVFQRKNICMTCRRSVVRSHPRRPNKFQCRVPGGGPRTVS